MVMIRYILFIGFFFFIQMAIGQNNGEIKGIVVDATGLPLEKATVSVVSAQDSIVLAYSLTNTKGQFDLVRLPVGKDLILFISHISSAPYEQPFNLKPNEKLNLDSMVMGTLSLDEVVVDYRPPIRLNGDTLEYKADYFKTRPNASVEELLQLLPGLQVNVDGTIYYQGRQVSGIRVNNKDFFAHDLTIATKNLDASLVDVVQVIKDRGDSKLEVMDENELPIVLNLKTKKEFVKANFGKFFGSGGTRDRYESGALVNTFRDTLQISFIGYANNLSRKGFDYSELSQYGGMNRAENMNFFYMSRGGLQNNISTGVNVNYDIQKKLKVNFMYNFDQQNDYTDNQNITDSYYGDVVENGQSTSQYDYRRYDHSLRAFARFIPDTTFRISLDIRANLVSGKNEGKDERNRMRDNGEPVLAGHSSEWETSSSPSYRHAFTTEKKLNPKVIVTLNHDLRSSSSSRDAVSDAFSRFYLFQDSVVDETVIRGNSSYTFVLDNRVGMELKHHKNLFTEYYAKYNWSTNNNLYDLSRRANSEEFVNRNDIANDKQLEEGQFFAGAKIKATLFKKLKAEVGSEFLDLTRKYDFYGKLDNATYRDYYLLSYASLAYAGLNASFYQRATSPSLSYFQVVSTGDFYPMSQTLISPYFDNQLANYYSLRYFTTLKRSKVNLSLSINYTQRNNGVGNDRVYDVENSYTTSQNYQTAGTAYYFANISARKVFLQKKDWKLNWSMFGYMNASENFRKVNGQENASTNYFGNVQNTISLSYKNKITVSPSYQINISALRNSVQHDFFRDVSNITHAFGTSLLLSDIRKFRLETSYTLSNQAFTLNNDRENRHLVNASLYYPVLGKGELKVTAFDILNQNQSVSVYGTGNTNTFSNRLTLRQYFMLGVVYKFLKASAK